MSKTLADINKELQETNHKEISNMEELAVQEILGGIPKKNIIPEVVFKDYFLDHFKNMAKGTVEDTTLTSKWIHGIAGTPYSEVDVVDDAGNVLFTVPGVVKRANLNVHKANDVSILKITNHYSLERNRMEARGDQYLAHALNGVENILEKTTNEDTVRWKNIFDRYDPNKKVESKKESVNTKLNDTLELVYD